MIAFDHLDHLEVLLYARCLRFLLIRNSLTPLSGTSADKSAVKDDYKHRYYQHICFLLIGSLKFIIFINISFIIELQLKAQIRPNHNHVTL